MKETTAREILKAVSGTLLSGDPDTLISFVTTDSRDIRENCLFVPIVGETMDAHRFIEQALLAGAKAVLTADQSRFVDFSEKYPGNDKVFILVSDTLTAMQSIGKLARSFIKMPAVGVTGSVGKTTTREMISCALSAGMKVFKTSKNYNNKLGVPLTLLELSDEDDVAVLELGLNVRDELGTISALTNLDCAVITNIGVAHIEFYGTQDEIAKEKFTVTRGFSEGRPEDKMLFLCGDDPFLMKYKDSTGYPYTIYGTQENAAYRAMNIRVENSKYCFDLYIRGEYALTVSLSALGRHNVLNAAGALAVADRFGIDLKKAAEKLSEFSGFRNRLQPYEHNGFLIIDDTYNASPASMKAGLDVLESFTFGNSGGRKIAILGDMFELGEKAPEYHYEVGAYAAGKKFDQLFVIGENAMEIKRAAEEREPSFKIFTYSDKDQIIEDLKRSLCPGDVVYIKASNGMKLHSITEGLCEDDE